jgi:GT2 family glycosyltransferase
VDNGSIDHSNALLDDLARTPHPDWLPASLPSRPVLIRNDRNLGFAGGNNQAIRLTSSRYVVALNNDALPDPNWLAELVTTASTAPPALGMVASAMLFAHRPTIVASAGISIHRDGVALDRAVGKDINELVHRGLRPVFGPSAGAALYTASMLRDVGLFDERFFSYLEDADLAWRARSRGWRAVLNPRARVLHEYSATGGHASPFKTTLISRNRVWLLYKNMPEVLLRRHAASIARYDVLAVANSLFKGDHYLPKGRLQALRSLPAFTADRRKITTSARLHPDEMDALLAPALSPRQHLRYRLRLDRLI